MGRRWLGLVELLLAASLYLGAAGLLTWPALLHLNEVIIGGGELGGWLWRYWWHFTELEALAGAGLDPLDRLSALLSLGRYPETGNILDVLALSYPLQAIAPLPAHYNLKIFVILVGDGLCGYALARSLTRQPAVAAAAGLIAVINPLNIQDIHGSGLRQVILWWVLLFPIALRSAEERQTPASGALAGVVLALAGAFYWFYGLFAGMFFGLWCLWLGWRERRSLPALLRHLRWIGPLLLSTALVAGVFFLPYAQGEGGANAGPGGTLPELSFFLPFPEYDVIRDVPLRPSNYEENVLSSLNRTIMSSWSVDYLFDPGHPRALPLAVLLVGLLPALWPGRRRDPSARFWLVVFLVFFLGTLGPFLKFGGDADSSKVVILGGEWVVRLPYTWMFRWVPGMSRMFGPYRMGALVVVAAVALVALGLGRAPGGRWGRALLSVGVIVGTALQVLYRWEIGPVAEGSFQPTMWRAPLKVSGIRVPEWYQQLDPQQLGGIIELPLEQQQDLLYFYQVQHQQKVYRSWATPPAIPPLLRKEGGGAAGERLRYLARPDRRGAAAGELLLQLSRSPEEANLEDLDPAQLAALAEGGNYRWLVVHERGYYLVDPRSGPVFYRDVVRRLEQKLGLAPQELVELAWFDYPGNEYKVPDGPVYVPWSSHEVSLPDQEMPNRYFMAVFDLGPLRARHADQLPAEEDPAAGEGAGPVHSEAPPGAPRPTPEPTPPAGAP